MLLISGVELPGSRRPGQGMLVDCVDGGWVANGLAKRLINDGTDSRVAAHGNCLPPLCVHVSCFRGLLTTFQHLIKYVGEQLSFLCTE